MAAQLTERPAPATNPVITDPAPGETICDVCLLPIQLDQLATTTLTVTVRGRGQANRRYETHRLCVGALLIEMARVLVDMEHPR